MGLVGADGASTPQVFRARADRTGDRPFLIWEDRTWSYAEAWTVIRRWAGFLRELGAEPGGGRVAGYLHNRPEAVWAWLGTQAAGCTYVSLNRGHRGALLADQLRRSRARVLVTEASALESIPDPVDAGIRNVVQVDRGDGQRGISGSEAERATPWTGPDPAPRRSGDDHVHVGDHWPFRRRRNPSQPALPGSGSLGGIRRDGSLG